MLPALKDRDTRILAHCREGLELARRVPEYHRTVLARLAPLLATPPDDLWTAVPWIWAVALGASPPATGALAADIESLGPVFADALTSGASPADITVAFRDICARRCDAGVVMRSHPFPDLRAWSLRTQLGV